MRRSLLTHARLGIALAASILLCLASCGDRPETSAPAKPASQPEPGPQVPPIAQPGPAASSAQTQLTQIAPVVGEKNYIAPLRDAYERIDPSKDGWKSEAFSEAALDQLHHLEPLLLDPASATPETLADLLSPQFTCAALRPIALEEIFTDPRLTVRRASKAAAPTGPPPATAATDFLQQIQAFSPGTGDGSKIKLKIFRVEPLADRAMATEVLVAIDRVSEDSRSQINATWRCSWSISADSPPRLASLEVEKFEEIIQRRSAERLFVDCTAAVLGGNQAYTEQFLTSTDHWRARLPRDLGLDSVANHGLAIGDINGDELDDLYVCQQGGLPNRLFIQNPDGTLRDITADSGTGWLDYCASALFLDLDNDGDRDLVVSQDFRVFVMSNDGAGKFTLEFGSSTKAQSFSMAAADYDNDGLVDFYICGYNPSAAEQRSGAMGEPMPFHDANNGGPNTLWHNDGNFNFSDVTAATGLDRNNRRYTFAAAWEDYDNDGDQDLYVANDYGRNCFYRNDAGRFTDVAPELRVEDTSSGMSVSWSDFNHDGLMDLYTSNMFSSAGNRITFQRQFKEGVPEEIRQQFQHIALGNTLFQAVPGAPFEDVGASAAVQMGRWAWGSKFVDFNNDGLDDILVANGFISTEDSGDL